MIADGAPQEVLNNPLVVAAYLGADAVAVHRSGAGRPSRRRRRRADADLRQPRDAGDR